MRRPRCRSYPEIIYNNPYQLIGDALTGFAGMSHTNMIIYVSLAAICA